MADAYGNDAVESQLPVDDLEIDGEDDIVLARQRARSTSNTPVQSLLNFTSRTQGVGGVWFRMMLGRLVTLSTAGLLASALLGSHTSPARAQTGNPKFAVEYQGTADFSSPAEEGSGVKDGVACCDYAAGTYQIHLEWKAVGTGLFADAPFSDEPVDPASSIFPLQFSSLSGSITYAPPNANDPRHCKGTLTQVPGSHLPSRGSLSPTNSGVNAYFGLRTVLPLDPVFVQSDNTSALFCSSVDRGPYQPNAVNGLPDFPAAILDDAWDSATKPIFVERLDSSSDDTATPDSPDVAAAPRSFDQTEHYDFDYEGPHARFLNVDGSPRAPIGTWKGHIHSSLHVWTGADSPDNIFDGAP